MASDVDIGELVSRLGDCKESVKPSAYSYGQNINTLTSEYFQIISRVRSAIELGLRKAEDHRPTFA